MSTPCENDPANCYRLYCQREGRCVLRAASEPATKPAMTTPTRTEFEAAAYQYIKTIEGQVLIVDLIRNKGSVEFDTAIAAAMGWPTVPEVKS